MIIDTCSKLTDLDLCDTRLSRQSVSYICKNLTSTMLRIDLSSRPVNDDNVQALVQQCPSLEYLDLTATEVTAAAIPFITNHLSRTLKALQLPNKVGLQLCLLEEKADLEKLGKIASMPKLEYLYISINPSLPSLG